MDLLNQVKNPKNKEEFVILVTKWKHYLLGILLRNEAIKIQDLNPKVVNIFL